MRSHDEYLEAMREAEEHAAQNMVAQCEADGGHVFEVTGEPPYRCTFCGFAHDETNSGKLVRSDQQ